MNRREEDNRLKQYLMEIQFSREVWQSNNVELNRTIRFFSGGIIVILAAYVDWETSSDCINRVWLLILSYTPFVLSIIINIICYFFVQDSFPSRQRLIYEYLMEGIESSRTEKGKHHYTIIFLSVSGIVLFVLGLIIVSLLFMFELLTFKGEGKNG